MSEVMHEVSSKRNEASTYREGYFEFEGAGDEKVVINYEVEVMDEPCEEAMYGEYLRRFTIKKGEEVLAKYGDNPGEWDVVPDLDFDEDCSIVLRQHRTNATIRIIQ